MLYLGQGVKEAVDARRLHHQLMPMELKYEDGVTKVSSVKLLKYMRLCVLVSVDG